MMNKRRDIGKQVIIYLQGTFTTQAVSVVLAIVARRLLGPVQMGVWSLLDVVLTYGKYTALGTMFASLREIPFYQGKGEPEKAEEVKNIVFSFAIISILPLSLGTVIYALAFRSRLGNELFYGLLLVSVLIILRRLSNVLVNFLRAYKYFEIAANQMVLSSLVNAVLIASLCYLYKIYGYILAMILSFLFNIIYIFFSSRLRFVWRFDLKKILYYISLGLPLLSLTIANTLFVTLDKLMIAKFLGFHSLGLYSIAVMAMGNISNFPNSVGIVLMPNFQEKYGETENKKDLQEYLEKSAYFFCDTMPLVIGAVWFIGPYFIHLVLPQFEGGVRAMQLLVMASFFLAADYPYGLFLVAIKKHLSMAGRMAIACLLAVCFNLLAIKSGWGLRGIALGTVAAVLFKFSSNFELVRRHLYSGHEALKKYGVIVTKFLWMAVVLVGIDRAFLWIHDPLIKAVAQFGTLIALYFPFILRLNSEFRVWRRLKEKLRVGRPDAEQPVD